MKRIQIDMGTIGYRANLMLVGYFGSMDTLPMIITDYLEDNIPVNLNNKPHL